MGASGSEGILQQEGEGGVFYDLGSGTGKPTFAALLVHPFAKAQGIEILESLHSVSEALLARWNDEAFAERIGTAPDVSFIHGSFLEAPWWEDADVVFMNSTCFDDTLMQHIATQAAGLKKGAFVISFTKRLPSHHFTVLEDEVYEMSWGGATVFIQQKTTDARLLPFLSSVLFLLD